MVPSVHKTVIITGAGAGIGRALALDLGSKGWNVAVVDVSVTAGQEVADTLGSNAIFIQAKVDDYHQQAHAFQETFSKWGRIDAACLNAGITDRFSLYQLDRRGFKDIPPRPDMACTDVCYKAVVYGTMLAIHFMRQNSTPGGQIIATSSAWGWYGVATSPEYSGAKAAVANFCRSAAPVTKVKDNITINAILPGVVHTSLSPQEMMDAYGPEYLTPVANVVAGFNKVLNDPDLNGQLVYCVGPTPDDILLAPHPGRLNGKQSEKVELVCEMPFVMVHGERSGVADSF